MNWKLCRISKMLLRKYFSCSVILSNIKTFIRFDVKLSSSNSFKSYSVYKRSISTSFNWRKSESHPISDNDCESVLSDQNFVTITNRFYRHPGMSHNVLVVQPRMKSGPMFEKVQESECKLDEAVALVNTLPQWRVTDKLIIATSKITSKFIFGSGNLKKLKLHIQKDLSISAIFVGVNIMTALQNSTLEAFFNVPVFDRYQIILQIFHDHAHTKEAKLQLALAEIPYLRVKLAGYSHTRDSSHFSGIHHVGGDGETFMEKRRRLLNERELKLKKALEKIKNQRQFLRTSDRRSAFPLIAVVGYTNCGKTTLIKALTNDVRLCPEDKLFATLDVTLHAGLLPSHQKVLFIDTVGFISDVPTTLIQSFKSTLEEVTLADLVIHVRDISHPDTEKQKTTVLKTLQELNLPEKLLNSIVEVRNKVDLLQSLPESSADVALYISAKNGMGLPELLDVTEQTLFKNTGHSVTLLRIPNGGVEYRWLMKEGGIRDAVADARDARYLIVETVLSVSSLAKFKHQFGDLTLSIEDLTQ